MLIKIGIAILILAIFGSMIGGILGWVQDVVCELFFGFFTLPGGVIVGIVVFFIVLRIIRWFIK